ncbi:hypothetical protein EV360DRAFT_53966, partial [Lentinula raphanica]
TISSIRACRRSIQHEVRIPYVLSTNERFAEEFKQCGSVLVSSKLECGVMPREHWSRPFWTTKENSAKARK